MDLALCRVQRLLELETYVRFARGKGWSKCVVDTNSSAERHMCSAESALRLTMSE